MAEFPTVEFAEHPQKSQITYFDIIFVIIALLASAFSAYTTFLGFSYDLPTGLSVVISIIIGLGLLAVNFKIRDYRRDGFNLTKPFIALFLFFIFSFISNTNAIYTYFLEKDIVGETQENAWKVFDSQTATLVQSLDKNNLTLQAQRVKQELDIARANLKKQIADPLNPGLGTEAKRHLREVQETLGEKLTSLKAPAHDAPLNDHIEYAEKLDNFIEQQFLTMFSNQVPAKIEVLRDKIKKLRNFYYGKIVNKEYSPETTDLMKRDLESLSVEAKTLVGFDEKLTSINNSADDIGSFQYTWVNFKNGIKSAAIILSILLGAMLDLLVPAISVLLYKSETEF